MTIPTWNYEPGEHRFKHCWQQNYASIERDGSRVVGKCPSTLHKDKARELLNEGEYLGKDVGNLYPDRMWNVYQGVVYEAVPTSQGSYHGYPWCARPGMNFIPRKIRATLEARALAEGYEKEFKAWMKKYG